MVRLIETILAVGAADCAVRHKRCLTNENHDEGSSSFRRWSGQRSERRVDYKSLVRRGRLAIPDWMAAKEGHHMRLSGQRS